MLAKLYKGLIVVTLILIIFTFGCVSPETDASVSPSSDSVSVSSEDKGLPSCGDGICNDKEQCCSDENHSYWVRCPEDCSRNFPNYYLESENFDDLLESIDISKGPTSDSNEILNRAQTVVNWMSEHYISGTLKSPENQECIEYADEIAECDSCDTSPATLGLIYKKYRKICRLSCHGAANVFATLMWKSGVSKDYLVVAGKATSNNEASSHWYAMIKIEEDTDKYWIIIDLTCSSTEIDKNCGLTCGDESRYKPCVYATPSQSVVISPTPSYCNDVDVPEGLNKVPYLSTNPSCEYNPHDIITLPVPS